MKTNFKGFFIIFILFLGVSSFTKGDIYLVKLEVLKYLIKKKGISKAYFVETVKTSSQKKSKVKKTSAEYIEIASKIALLEKEKEAIDKKNDSITKQFNDVNLIVKNINSFLSSSKPFEVKKTFLKESQILAFKYNIKDLIYADKEINTSKKSKILVLSLSPIEYKIHLKRVISNIRKNNKQPNLEIFNNHDLTILKEKITTIKPFYYVYQLGKKHSKQKTIAKKEVTDISVLSGKFEDLGIHYLLDQGNGSFIKNQIITGTDLEQINTNRVKYKIISLIKNVENNHVFAVQENFLSEYGYKPNIAK